MIGVIGISQKSANVIEDRESLSQEFLTLVQANPLFMDLQHVLVRTCNRTEWYYSAEDPEAIYEKMRLLLSPLFKEFQLQMVYAHFGIHSFIHLYQVVSGIDSPFFGETEIQGQIKNAYLLSCSEKKSNSELHFLFQKALHAGKIIRKELPQSKVEQLQLDQVIINRMKEALLQKVPIFPLLLIGASAIHHRIFQTLQTEFPNSNVIIANRTESRAREFAKKFGITHIPFHQAINNITQFATVSFALTLGHRGHFISKENFEITLSSGRPALFDIGFPRNVDPDLYPFFSQVHTMETLLPKDENGLDIAPIKPNVEALSRELAIEYYDKSNKKFKIQSSLDSVEMV